MVIVDELRALDKPQRAAFIAALLGWALDAFDFFLLTFVLKDIATEFHTDVKQVAVAITLTLAARPVGAFVFGRLADTYGRRPVLMIDVAVYAALAFVSAFSPNLITLLVLRTLFGFAMGGEWGIGASLALETIPAKSRGVVSGILQEGYPVGFFLASIANLFLPTIGWRGLVMMSALPALLILFIRAHVPESPAWQTARATRAAGRGVSFAAAMKGRWGLLVYVVVLMTAFNFFSHGTQDLYPTFLKVQHRFSAGMVTALTIVLNLGAIVGGLIFGALSEKIGRRRAIVIAALLALPIIPLWAFSATPLMLGLGAFLIQVSVQGAWGVVPAHLNELSPEGARGAFPGFAYQLGNLFAAGNATWQAGLAESRGDDYGFALALVCGVVAVILALVTWFGPEAKGRAFGTAQGDAP
ncbi:MAG TPA: MFS transporter [Phenylobacterium sp.]|uniref:MFS transporter n=1 Tax=Phenylobacterium sp. TaxID=1871053 RepID=UPI002BFF6DB5|nr:MFS transporter [Phenylobacterium sp.]HSV02793.1 MFS transporter [Phenylobacterium sp.]